MPNWHLQSQYDRINGFPQILNPTIQSLFILLHISQSRLIIILFKLFFSCKVMYITLTRTFNRKRCFGWCHTRIVHSPGPVLICHATWSTAVLARGIPHFFDKQIQRMCIIYQLHTSCFNCLKYIVISSKYLLKSSPYLLRQSLINAQC